MWFFNQNRIRNFICRFTTAYMLELHVATFINVRKILQERHHGDVAFSFQFLPDCSAVFVWLHDRGVDG